jgi:hypothetical protein
MHEETRRTLAELVREKVALIEEPVLPDSVVDVLATVGAGYLAAGARPLPILEAPPPAANSHHELAGELVRRFHDGLHPMPPEPSHHQDRFRVGVDEPQDARPDVDQDSMLRDQARDLSRSLRLAGRALLSRRPRLMQPHMRWARLHRCV